MSLTAFPDAICLRLSKVGFPDEAWTDPKLYPWSRVVTKLYCLQPVDVYSIGRWLDLVEFNHADEITFSDFLALLRDEDEAGSLRADLVLDNPFLHGIIMGFASPYSTAKIDPLARMDQVKLDAIPRRALVDMGVAVCLWSREECIRQLFKGSVGGSESDQANKLGLIDDSQVTDVCKAHGAELLRVHERRETRTYEHTPPTTD
jgi:hypothetical protein